MSSILCSEFSEIARLLAERSESSEFSEPSNKCYSNYSEYLWWYINYQYYTTMAGHRFLPRQGHFKALKVYQIAEMIYDLTYHFAHRHLQRGDRTIDQMIQAARSGKQNIAEGSLAAMTSTESEIKLTNVAKASLGELLLDYEDYLRVRHLPQWSQGHPRYEALRRYSREPALLVNYRELMQRLTAEELANLCITLLHQEDVLLERLIAHQEKRFVERGGIRESMSQARRRYRDTHG